MGFRRKKMKAGMKPRPEMLEFLTRSSVPGPEHDDALSSSSGASPAPVRSEHARRTAIVQAYDQLQNMLAEISWLDISDRSKMEHFDSSSLLSLCTTISFVRAIRPKLESQISRLGATESLLGHSERVASFLSTATPLTEAATAGAETTDWWARRRELECDQWLLPERPEVARVSPQSSTYATLSGLLALVTHRQQLQLETLHYRLRELSFNTLVPALQAQSGERLSRGMFLSVYRLVYWLTLNRDVHLVHRVK